jgi:hypothetical protein
MKISKGLRQAYDLQDFTYEAALALRASLHSAAQLRKGKDKGKVHITRDDAAAISALVKAWESCQERVRIHRNKPMPGVLRPTGRKPRTDPRPSRLVAPASPGSTTSTVEPMAAA